MGLDMYLTGEKYFQNHPFDERGAKKTEGYNLGYWRKHPNLHGFIVEEFANGEDNCQRIDLGIDDLRRIYAAVDADDLPHTVGFFFGESDGSEREETLQIIREAILWAETEEEGVWRSVYYQASW